MKIYQLHEHGGSYEDYYNNIVGTFLRKEKAEEVKLLAEITELKLRERGARCMQCPYCAAMFENMEQMLSEYPDYCEDLELMFDDDGYAYCPNWTVKWEDSEFYIKEVDVDES